MIIRQEHLRLLHAGTQTTLANIRLKYWPINGRREVKKVIHSCVTCYKFRVTTQTQLMSDLPLSRINPVRPFLNVGTDYAGPIMLKSSRLRKAPLIKSYIALFICFVTKAIHLELVTSLSTDAFIAALRRFISRRGRCATIHSDNGTNFVGAKHHLHELFKYFKNEQERNKLIEAVSVEGIEWKFIPAHAPHFGGLWEGAIKLVKLHIRRVIGNTILTFEEYYTFLTQVEAIVNSRPLIAVSDDVTDCGYLSPGHFLINDVIASFPEPQSKCNNDILKCWQDVNNLKQLQGRKKWYKTNPNLQNGTIVLVKEDHIPPLQWNIAKVVETKKEPDDKIRVAIIKTAKGLYTRPITKLCPLPFNM
ncbi:uncharacterized protein LOC113381111 [Ctenocephalides felis]|uniref:uncharacterized protein LOC113381111 n=1 Tax=Ctenocephalides felis TaxID=7515 RepID=UPI000E6E3B50|nr:uncharacterized protein LOC113381111 [Ctenocephalides felis]